MKIALLQIPVTTNKAENMQTAAVYVARAKEQGASIAVLPEMFFCPYSNQYFTQFSEQRGEESYLAMSNMAKDNALTLVAGSMPEREGDKLYNTCFVFDGDGRQIARHRKVHLFDIDVKGGQRFFESHTFTPGQDITTFTVDGHTFGVCICFDIRFPEMFRSTTLAGAKAIFVPASFNMTTGPMHWELSFRMRAVDNQVFVLGAAPARDETGSYVSYANSIACSPWGAVVARAGAAPELLMVDIDLDEVASVREQLPLLSARKTDLYAAWEKGRYFIRSRRTPPC